MSRVRKEVLPFGGIGETKKNDDFGFRLVVEDMQQGLKEGI